MNAQESSICGARFIRLFKAAVIVVKEAAYRTRFTTRFQREPYSEYSVNDYFYFI